MNQHQSQAVAESIKPTIPRADFVRRATEKVLFRQACRAAVATGGFRAAWIGFPRGIDDRPGIMLASAIPADPDAPGSAQELYIGGAPAHAPWLAPISPILSQELLDPTPGSPLFEWQRTAVYLQLRHEAQTIGVFALYPTPGRRVSNDELAWLQRLADDLATAVVRSRISLLVQQALDVGASTSMPATAPYGGLSDFPDINAVFLAARPGTGQPQADKLDEQALLLDMATDAIVVRGLDHGISYWSRHAERLFGWTSAEAVGHSERDLLYAENGPFDEAMATLLREGDWAGEIVQSDKSGARRVMDGHWLLMRDDAGRPQAVLAVYTDITTRRQLEDQFLRVQRIESIGTLAGGIAHDLNNVLTPILLSVDVLRLDEHDPDRLETLAMIAASARKGADMLHRVLSFARGVGGRRSELDVGPLLDEVQKIARGIFPKNIQVHNARPTGLWPVLGDPTQLHQVILNLAVNARDAMPDGGTLAFRAENVMVDEHYARVEMHAAPGPYVVIEVADSGTGMSESVRARVFEPFFTTKEPGQGTGLGLSTSLAIVTSHGGFIEVRSQPGNGTSFRIHVPAFCPSQDGDSSVVPD